MKNEGLENNVATKKNELLETEGDRGWGCRKSQNDMENYQWGNASEI